MNPGTLLSAVLWALSATYLPPRQRQVHQYNLPNTDKLTIQFFTDRLDPPKESPKLFNDQRWEFDWLTSGYGNLGEEGVGALRVRVYSQERKEESEDIAPKVARMALRIWDRTFHRLKIDSPHDFNGGIIDYFLCFGGKAGGEQLFDKELVRDRVDPSRTNVVRVNTIYIYRLDTFKEPIEMAREVAHEYGHAILPPIGGFKQPEVWADGYLGEKLFLKWIRNDIAAGRLTPDDAMGASLDKLSAWVAQNVDPLADQAAYQEPVPALINESKGGMDDFIGLALYVEALCPPAVFTRSLEYTADAHKGSGENGVTLPTDYATYVSQAASEMESLTLSVPKSVFDSKKPIWIPMAKGTCTGARVITRRGGWAQVAPLTPNIIVKNPPIH
ncbi:MAG TPA: hypothetical protein VHE55_12350 [Fimbriimonadaceae bacterium]|nr:hypothetical protein [Fimbriimonadaceae bacterium]